MGDRAPQHELAGMKTFIGCKVIQAVAMDLAKFNQRQGKPIADPPSENVSGYMVRYPDGYTSWSPKHVFEEAYREINPSEIAMCQ